MSSIYDISAELRGIQDKLLSGEAIDQETGEILPSIVNELALTQQNLQNKAIDCGYILKSFDDEIDLYDREIKRLTERKRVLQNTKQRINDSIKNAMIEFGITKIKGKTLTIGLRESESVEITDETLIDEQYKRIKVEADKVAIKNALRNGEDVQGARLVKNQNLQIR